MTAPDDTGTPGTAASRTAAAESERVHADQWFTLLVFLVVNIAILVSYGVAEHAWLTRRP